MTRDLVYGRQPVRELVRGPRELLEVWATERAAAQIPWLDSAPRPAGQAGAASSARLPARATIKVSSPGASRSATRTPTSWRARASSARLPRPGHRSAQPGRGRPQRRGSGRDAASWCLRTARCGSHRRSARSSAGAVEHLPVAVVPNLARYLAEIKGADLWAYAADSEGSLSMWSADLTGGVALVLGRGGQGGPPPGSANLRCGGLDPALRPRRLPQRQRGCSTAPVRGETPAGRRRLGTRDGRPTLYLFDGFNLFHAGEFWSPEELIDVLASFVAERGARGVVGVRRSRRGAADRPSVRPLRGPCRRPPGATRRRASRRRARLHRLLGRRRAQGVRPGGAETDVPALPRRLATGATSRAGAARLGKPGRRSARRGHPRTTRTSPSRREDVERPGSSLRRDDVRDAGTRVALQEDVCSEWSWIARKRESDGASERTFLAIY